MNETKNPSPGSRRPLPRRAWALPLLLLVWPAPAHPQCAGDCNDDGYVTVDELVLGSQIALERAEMSDCPELDVDKSGALSVDELVDAVASAFRGCSDTPTPTGTVTATPIATATRTDTPTSSPTAPPPPSVTATSSTTPTPTATHTGTSTPTVTPTQIPTEAVDRTPRGAFRQVQVSTQGATRLTLLTLDWLKLVDQIDELALSAGASFGVCDDEPVALCTVSNGTSRRTISYPNCRTETESGHRVRRAGTISQTVSNETFCKDAAIGLEDEVTLTLSGYEQREETADGMLLAHVAADLSITRTGLGQENCAGLDVEERVAGMFHVRCTPDAESIDCPESGADVTFGVPELERIIRSQGGFCRRTMTVTGQWLIENNATGESFPQSFDAFTVAQQEAPGGSGVSVTISGDFAAQCLGAVSIRPSVLFASEGEMCPTSGSIDMLRPGSQPDSALQQAGAPSLAALGPAPSPTPDGEGFEQRLFRSANGQVYQVLQFDAGPGENGAEAIQVTTLVGSLGGSVAGCFNTAGDEIPTAVTGVRAGRAFAPEAVFKSSILGHVDQLCFNPNAAQGNGAVCVGTECAADCHCAAAAECSTFGLGDAEQTPITTGSAGLPSARVAVLDAPFPPCDGFAGRAAYAFGTSSSPSTEQVLCAAPPNDGITLPSGSTVVFAYETLALELFNAGAAGLLIDQNGDSAANCETSPAVLSPGLTVAGTSFEPRAAFQEGNLVFRYDDDPEDRDQPPDAAIEGCEIDVLIQCEPAPTPTPTPGAERPCGAVALDALSANPVEGSMENHVSDETGWCGLPTGDRDIVYELTAPEPGSYVVRVRGATFDPLLYARREECEGVAVSGACTKDPSAGVRDRDLELELVEGERVAIVVDGGRRDSDQFTLTTSLRQPDLIVQSVSALPGAANAGESVEVSATITNQGDGDAGAFAIDFILANDQTGMSVVSIVPLRCPLNQGLAAGQTTVCKAPNDFPLPLIAGGEYFLVARADGLGQVREAHETNNVGSIPFTLGAAPGSILVQDVFRVGDGTTYQVIRAVPRPDGSGTGIHRITTLAASVQSVQTCASGPGSQTGDPLVGVVGTAPNETLDPSRILHSGILRPNNFGTPRLVEKFDGGRLLLGAAEGVIEICSRPDRCSGQELFELALGGGGIPAACVAHSAMGPYCTTEEIRESIAFGLEQSDGECSNPNDVSAGTGTCFASTTLRGFDLDPGEAVVFVHAPGRDSFESGVGSFGLAADGGNVAECGSGQVITGDGNRNRQERVPFLTFVERQTRSAPSSVATQGQNVYATAVDGLFVFRRDSEDGSLRLIQEHRDGRAGVDGLHQAESIAVSPGGKHVYVTSRFDDTVAVFARDESTGMLIFVEVQRDGVGGVNGIDGARSVSLSPDGRNVYVPSQTALGSVAVFARNELSGSLTFIEAITHDGLVAARSVAISADGRHAYVAAEVDNAVVVFARNQATGRLTFVQVLRSGVDGVAGLLGARAVAVSSDGRHVYVASFFDDAVAVFGRDAMAGTLSFVEVQKLACGVDQEHCTSIAGLDGATSLTFDSPGEYLYVASLSSDTVTVFARNEISGALTFVERQVDGADGVDGLDGAFFVTVSQDGRNLYVASLIDESVTSFVLDEASGRLSFGKTQSDGVRGVLGLDGATSVTLSPDQRHVYVASQAGNAIALFGRDETTGRLAFRQALECEYDAAEERCTGVDGLRQPRSLAVSPDGRHVYVTSFLGDAVTVFARDEDSGDLSLVETQRDGTGGVDGLDGAFGVAVSPNGNHVYVASQADDGVSVLARDETSGRLTFQQALKCEYDMIAGQCAGVQGLRGARSVTVAPDGSHVYVASQLDHSLVVFARIEETGELSFVELERDGFDGVEVLRAPRSVAVSSDSRYVYVASELDDAVSVFRSDEQSGTLSFVEAQIDGKGGVDGLNEASAVTIGPSGRYLYVTSYADDAVVVFERDPKAGNLSFVEFRRDGLDDVDGLNGASSVAATADGKHVYVASFFDDAVAVFAVND